MYFLDIFIAMGLESMLCESLLIAPIDACINVIENTMTMGAASFVDFMVSFMVGLSSQANMDPTVSPSAPTLVHPFVIVIYCNYYFVKYSAIVSLRLSAVRPTSKFLLIVEIKSFSH